MTVPKMCDESRTEGWVTGCTNSALLILLIASPFFFGLTGLIVVAVL